MNTNPTIPIPAFSKGVYPGYLSWPIKKKYLQPYLDEYSFRFNRRDFGAALLERLTLAVSLSHMAD